MRTLKTNKRPKLKAKAGQARRLVDFAASLAREFQGADGEMGLHRHKAMTAFKVVFGLAGQTQLTRKDMVSWRWNAAVHMFHYASCGFAVYPKFHYALHMPEQVECGGAPRNFWVYSDESKNREAKQIWNACSKGWSVAQQVILRMGYMWALKAIEAEQARRK